MLHLCNVCNKPLRTGDAIKVMVTAVYKELKSEIHYAISQPHDAFAETLQHIDCVDTQAPLEEKWPYE